MANFKDVTRKLVILMDDGVSLSGTNKTKSRTFAGLSEEASAENVLKAGRAIASLMANSVLSIFVNDKNEVVNE